MIVSLEKVSLAYLKKPILDQVSLVINEKEKWGVVGANGAGKSTLLKILAQIEKPDSGNVTVLPSVRIAYCPQISEWKEEETVLEAVLSGCEKEKAAEYEAKRILGKLKMEDWSRPIAQCSGGQRKRVALARALIQPSDLLLLDEPTNHLDQQMILWLEKTLIRLNQALVLVTHDRYFLNRITDQMIEVDQGKLYTYAGNYADYLEQRQQRIEQLASKEQKRQNFLRKESEWIRRGAMARSTKSKERIARFERISAEAPAIQPQSSLQLESAAFRLGKKTIELKHASKSYGGRVLFDDFSYLLGRHDRIGIIGPNGCGKTTLLKMILKQVAPEKGEIEWGETVRIGYFSQHCEELDPQKRVIEVLQQFGEQVTTATGEKISAAKMLERFQFTADEQYTPVGRCSGGQKRRLSLLLVLMQAPNVLLLDEPTNDLDVKTLTLLEAYLEDFNGAVLAVSHDRYFLDKIADRLFVFEKGQIQVLNTDYSSYLEEHEKKTVQEKKNLGKNKTVLKSKSCGLSYLEKKELDDLNRKLPQMSQHIQQLESQLAEAASEFSKLRKISLNLQQARQQLEDATERWMELSEKEQG